MAPPLTDVPCPEGGEIDPAGAVVCRDPEDLSRKAAAELVKLLDASTAERGRFTLALSGGATPARLYALLAHPEWRERIPWDKVCLFWGDERCVPPDHPESNYRMAREALIARVPIPEGNVYRIEGEKEPRVAASAYEDLLRGFFGLREGEFPRFDLILLGVGEDGHTASIFPGSEALEEQKRLAAAVCVERLRSWRVTLTLPVLNHTAHAWLLASGKNKAAIVKRILCGAPGASRLPARLVRPAQGSALWFLDEAALSALSGAGES